MGVRTSFSVGRSVTWLAVWDQRMGRPLSRIMAELLSDTAPARRRPRTIGLSMTEERDGVRSSY